MKLKYRGPFATVDVVGVGLVQRGEPFEVSDEIGESLLEQADNYTAVKRTASAVTATDQEA